MESHALLGQIKKLGGDQHTNNVAFGRTVLVNDMFEHSYHVDYGARAGEYVDAFLRNLSWDECNRRFETAENAYGALRA